MATTIVTYDSVSTPREKRPEEYGWFVYVLRNGKTNAVYTGCSNDPNRRIRAHKGELSGGAKTTRQWVVKHGPQVVLPFVQVPWSHGFPCPTAQGTDHVMSHRQVPVVLPC